VTAEERALVEARLASDSQAAALVSELRTLSRAVQSLPREKLGRDLRLLVEADLEEAESAATAEVVPVTPPYDRWAGIRRGLLWSAVAIAATIAMVMLSPEQANRNERDVARVAEKQQPEKVGQGEAIVDEAGAPPGLRGSMKPLPTQEPARPAEEPAAPALHGGTAVASSKSQDAPKLDSPEGARRALSGPQPEAAMPERDRSEVGQPAAEKETLAKDARGKKPLQAHPEGDAQQAGMAANQPANLDADALAAMSAARRVRELRDAADASTRRYDLEVKSPEGLTRFEQLLAEQNIRLYGEREGLADVKAMAGEELNSNRPTNKQENEKLSESRPLATNAAGAEGKVGEGAEGQLFARGHSSVSGAASETSPEEQVIVEASPEQIEELYRACVSDESLFALAQPQARENKAKSIEENRSHFFSDADGKSTEPGAYAFGGGLGGGRAAPRSSAAGAAGEPAANKGRRDALEQRKGGEAATIGWAWRVPAVSSDAKKASELALGAEVNGSVLMSQEAAPAPAASSSSGGTVATMKAPKKVGDGKVQALFVLRRAPAPIAAESPAAATAPAAAPAAAAPTKSQP
jgi:hypothetical protein